MDQYKTIESILNNGLKGQAANLGIVEKALEAIGEEFQVDTAGWLIMVLNDVIKVFNPEQDLAASIYFDTDKVIRSFMVHQVPFHQGIKESPALYKEEVAPEEESAWPVITQKQAKAVLMVKQEQEENDLLRYANGDNQYLQKDYESLEDFSFDELVTILYKGYVVAPEAATEEDKGKVLRYLYEKSKKAEEQDNEEGFTISAAQNSGYQQGIEVALQTLGIKITGINC